MQTLPSTAVRPVTVWARWLLLISSMLAFFAGIQLFVLSDQTEVYFAWTIHPPLTAAFLGAGYWSGSVLLFLSSRERLWARARVAMVGVGTVAFVLTITTFLHLSLFHLSSADVRPLASAWIWLGVYILYPLAWLVVFIRQCRVPGRDLARDIPLPLWVRIGQGIGATLLVALGTALFLAPQTALLLWPWKLTPLTAQAISAFLFGVAAVTIQTCWENDWRRVQAAAISYTAFSVLQLLALARYVPEVDWQRPSAWIYLLFCLGMIALSLSTLSIVWRTNRRFKLFFAGKGREA